MKNSIRNLHGVRRPTTEEEKWIDLLRDMNELHRRTSAVLRDGGLPPGLDAADAAEVRETGLAQNGQLRTAIALLEEKLPGAVIVEANRDSQPGPAALQDVECLRREGKPVPEALQQRAYDFLHRLRTPPPQ